jgi:hypothetical protein
LDITRLDVLGNQTYESLARNGETMTTAVMAICAYDKTDQARTLWFRRASRVSNTRAAQAKTR